MPCSRLALWLLLGLGAPVAAQVDAPALFANNCAKCHGLDGSGTGPTVLDRPARNFKEGGFSFGNTPAVIARTIAHGIPGSPMPSFEGAFSDEQLRALAEYVVTLGPPVKEVSEAETLLHVTDRPLVVRGILPPIEEGGAIIPRGLLIGTTDGLTFQYAADDVRLLAVRQGDFVKRTDWGDRGGSPLEPLGKVVWKAPGQLGTWTYLGGSVDGQSIASKPGHARLLSTSVLGEPSISYAVVTESEDGGSATLLATVVETLSSAKLGEYSGFARRFDVTPRWESAQVHFRGGEFVDLFPSSEKPPSISHGVVLSDWMTRRINADTGEVIRVVAGDPTWTGTEALVSWEWTKVPLTFTIKTFVISPWTAETLARVRELAQR